MRTNLRAIFNPNCFALHCVALQSTQGFALLVIAAYLTITIIINIIITIISTITVIFKIMINALVCTYVCVIDFVTFFC